MRLAAPAAPPADDRGRASSSSPLFTLVAIFAPLLEPYSVDAARAAPPSRRRRRPTGWARDDAGVDMLSLVIAGTQNSMLVGFAAAAVAVLIGGALGIVAGYRGSWGETRSPGVTDFFLVIPALPLMIVLAALFGQTIYHIVLVIGLLCWMSVTYVVRAQVHTLKERGFVRRARSLGAGDLYIIRRHILPHVAPLLVAQTVLTVAAAVFFEAALAFIGLGDPQRVSWGTIIQNAFLHSAVSSGAWWAIVPPGVCIALVVLGCFLIGQGVEEAMNPRLGSAHVSPRSFSLRARRRAEDDAVSVLELAGLHVWFDAPDGRASHAVRGVDLTVDAGERVGVLGESGCGKTTMILAAMGLLPPFASVGGSVRLDGIDVLAGGEQSARAVRWTHAAMVFQGAMSAMNPVHRVGKQIADPMVFHRQRSRGRGARAHAPSCSSSSACRPRWRAATRTSSPAACASAP